MSPEDQVPNSEPVLYTTRQVAEQLSISPVAVRDHISAGRIKAINVGTNLRPRLRIHRDDLARYLQDNTVQPAGKE